MRFEFGLKLLDGSGNVFQIEEIDTGDSFLVHSSIILAHHSLIVPLLGQYFLQELLWSNSMPDLGQ